MARAGYWNHNVHYRAVYGKANPGAPIKDPEMTWAEVRAAACRLACATAATCYSATRCSGANRVANAMSRP